MRLFEASSTGAAPSRPNGPVPEGVSWLHVGVPPAKESCQTSEKLVLLSYPPKRTRRALALSQTPEERLRAGGGVPEGERCAQAGVALANDKAQTSLSRERPTFPP